MSRSARLRVGRLVDVDHRAAVGVGERPDTVQRRLACERARAVAAAAQDDERNQPWLPHQRDRSIPAGHAHQLDRRRIEPGC